MVVRFGSWGWLVLTVLAGHLSSVLAIDNVCPTQCNARLGPSDTRSYNSIVAALGIEDCPIGRDMCQSSSTRCKDIRVECVCVDCTVYFSRLEIIPSPSSRSLSVVRTFPAFVEFDYLETLLIQGTTIGEKLPQISGSRIRSMEVINNPHLNGTLAKSMLPPNLRILDLSNNSLYGTIPNLFEELPQLSIVLLANNEFDFVDPNVFDHAFDVLDISNNKLFGPFPRFCTEPSEVSDEIEYRQLNRRALLAQICYVNGQRVPTLSPTVRSDCGAFELYGSNSDPIARSEFGFASVRRFPEDVTDIDGLTFSLQFSPEYPYFATETFTQTNASKPSDVASRVQLVLFSSEVSPNKPAMLFDIFAHMDGYISARIFARINDTFVVLGQGAKRASVYGNASEVPVFCSWKRTRALDIKCGIVHEVAVAEVASKDEVLENIVLGARGFAIGVDASMADLAPISLGHASLSQFHPYNGPVQLSSWTPLLEARNLKGIPAEGVPIECTARNPRNGQNVTCDPITFEGFTYIDAKGKRSKRLNGCQSIDQYSPYQSRNFKGQGLSWCPIDLDGSVYSKRIRLRSRNLDWAICHDYCGSSEALPLSSSEERFANMEQSESPAVSVTYRFEYCEKPHTEFLPYRCNPFNCKDLSVRCVDDPLVGDRCGPENDIDRCERQGVSIAACPIDLYYTCHSGKCVPIEIGATGCNQFGGVRFSPLYCGDAQPEVESSPSPTSNPSSPLPISESPTLYTNVTGVATSSNLAAPVAASVVGTGVLICAVGLFCLRGGRKRQQDIRLPGAKVADVSAKGISLFSSGTPESLAPTPVAPSDLSQPSPSSVERMQNDPLVAILTDALQTRSSSRRQGGPASNTIFPLASVASGASSATNSPVKYAQSDLKLQQSDFDEPASANPASDGETKGPGLNRFYKADSTSPLKRQSDLGEGVHVALSISFDELELGEMMGGGANGRIFRATYNGTPVAVKELYSVMKGSASEFCREFEALKMLRHPHIIQLFGACVAPSADALGMSRYFIVTELAHESLADRLGREDCPIDDALALRYVTEIASAGAFIHSQGLIHFDIKPQNILLDMGNTVKICDLGIAKFVQMTNQGEHYVTLTSAQGTPAYMSPELLANDDPSKISQKVDVYAFGVVAWVISHRMPPYPVAWSLLTLFKHVESGYRPHIDDERLPPDSLLRQVIEMCWQGDPELRPTFKYVLSLLRQKRRHNEAGEVESSYIGLPSPPRSVSRLTLSPDPGARVRIRRGLEFESGTVLSVNEDGSVSVQVDPESSVFNLSQPEDILKPKYIDMVQPQDIVQVQQSSEGDAFVPVDRTIRGLALSHARRKVQEFKRAMQEGAQRQPSEGARLLRKLSMTQQATGNVFAQDDIKFVVRKREDDDERTPPLSPVPIRTMEEEEEDSEEPRSEPEPQPGLGLKLDLDELQKSLPGLERDNSVVNLEAGLLISDGVPLNVSGGLTCHSKRRIFKKDVDTSFNHLNLSRINDVEEDALATFPAISQENVVIISELGSGACGMVYKAIHLSTLQLLAIKRVNVADRLKRHQVVRETRIMLANNLQVNRPTNGDTPTLQSSVSARDLSGTDVGNMSFTPLSSGSRRSRRVRSTRSERALRLGLSKRFASTNTPTTLVVSPLRKVSEGRMLLRSGSSARSMLPAKLHNPGDATSTEDVARGITEVKASSFACEKIVKLYDAALFSREMFADSMRVASDGSEKDFALVMEYLDGGSLDDHIKHSGPCTDELILAKVAADCLEGLHFLEVNRILHRDIKPANILLSRRGTAKLTDFGVVKEIEDDAPEIGKTFVGTITYMSPERLRGLPYSFVSDIWSLGLTLLAFALGRYPIPRERARNIFALLEYLETEDLFAGLEDRLSPELLSFLRTSLAIDPSQRASAKDLLNHPFILAHLSVSSFFQDEQPQLPREDRTIDLELIARRVVEKLLVDWMSQQETDELPRGGLEFTFEEDSFHRLARQLGVTFEEVQGAFSEQVSRIRDLLV